MAKCKRISDDTNWLSSPAFGLDIPAVRRAYMERLYCLLMSIWLVVCQFVA